MTQSTVRPLNVALVGCGQIADAHLQELAKIPTALVVAVCDAYVDLARQAADRFGVAGVFTDLGEMLATTNPDVLHIATPAHTHTRLALQALQAGVHVYVEKPFTLNADEAHKVIAEADRHGLSVCVGHDQLFDPIWLEARRLIDRGAIGEVRHIESILGYPISGQFGSQVTADANHWVRQLPGGLFQNTISHPLYRIADLMEDEHPLIIARWWRRDEFDFPTELTAHFQGETVTGTLTFHTRITAHRVTRIYGARGGFDVDFDTQIIRQHGSASLPGAFAKLEAGFRQWRESARNFRKNTFRFLRGDIHYFAGMKNLFQRFYDSIQNEEPAPITPQEIVRVTRWMDEVFDCCRECEATEVATHTKQQARHHERVGALTSSTTGN